MAGYEGNTAFEDSFIDGKHIPGTSANAGFIPQWMVDLVGGTHEAVVQLDNFPYATDSGSFGGRAMVETLQKILIKLGFDKVYGVKVTGLQDEPTILSMKYLLGPNWEILKWKDLFWDMQNRMDRRDYYPAMGETEEESKPTVPWIIWAALGITGLVMLIDK